MSDLVAQAIAHLRHIGVDVAPGLSDREFTRIEETFGFTFNAEHHTFLATALPISDRWINWRAASNDELRERLAWPIDSAIFDVHSNDFWPASWGERPNTKAQTEQKAREQLNRVPRLVPIYGHRYLPAAPAPTPSPVFSVYQSDVIYYGSDLLDYVRREFGSSPPSWEGMGTSKHVAFWSNLAEGAENSDL